MKHPVSLDIEKQFRDAISRDGVPANCLYRIPYTVNKYWQNSDFRIVEQDYDGKDAYLSLIEISTEETLSLIISTILPDLFWLYQLKGSIKIELYPIGTKHNGFLDQLQEDEYALFYSPPREYKITVEPGLHLLFLFVVDSSWLQRHPIVEPTHFQKLIMHLQHKKDTYNSTKVLSINDEIRKEILHLLTMPDFEEMLMDAKIYPPLVKLILISREHLKMNGVPVSRNMRETLMLIRSYFEKQISLGQAPPITEVARHFKIGLQQLRLQHKAVYGQSLQSYITEKRMETAESLLLETEEPITTIAYTLGYELNTFQKQFRNQFNTSPSEYRRLNKK